MFSKLFEGLYRKIFINIVVGISTSAVYVEEYKKQTLINSYSKTFNTTTIDTQMYEYIESFKAESPFNYIALLDDSSVQGAVPTCDKKEISFYCDIDSSNYKCYEDRWAYYSSKSELNLVQNKYSKIGLDFIFSPFLVLAYFFKDKIASPVALYILIEEQRISLAVFERDELLYADYLKMDSIHVEEGGLEYDISEDDDDIDLELESDIDLDELESIEDLEDFGDIEDLSNVEELDDFSESQEEELEEEVEKSSVDDIDGFNEDYNRFTRVQYSVNNYYQDSKYESRFLEKIYIADSVGVGRELKRYFEEEMFLTVFARRLELSTELCEIARSEIT